MPMNIKEIESEFQELDEQIAALRIRKSELLSKIRAAAQAEHEDRMKELARTGKAPVSIVFGKGA